MSLSTVRKYMCLYCYEEVETGKQLVPHSQDCMRSIVEDLEHVGDKETLKAWGLS